MTYPTHSENRPNNPELATFWSLSADQVLQQTGSSPTGLSSPEAKQRLSEYGANSLRRSRKASPWLLSRPDQPAPPLEYGLHSQLYAGVWPTQFGV
jgi:magnesium-transporting ATPase (P-type)